jgi:hypothetical protein
MRAIQLYASGIADSVIEGRSTAPALAVSEDEFVELDEQGNPKPKAARGKPRREAPVRGRRPAVAAAPVRRKPQPSVAAAVVVAAPVEGDEAEIVDVPEAADGEVAPATSASAPRRKATTGAPRRRG